MKLSIKITGHTISDLESAIDETKRLVNEDFHSGLNSNETGSFSFVRTGEEIWQYAVKDANGHISADRFDQFDEADSATFFGATVVGMTDTGREVSLKDEESSPPLLVTLEKVKCFIEGFEDDENQDGIKDLLKDVRDAIAKLRDEGGGL